MADPLKTVEPALFELLKGLAGGNVFELEAAPSQAYPFIIYQRTDSARWRAINNPSGIAQAYVQIDCYASGENGGTGSQQARELAAQVESILDGFRGTVYFGATSPKQFVKIAGISLQSDQGLLDDSEPHLFRNLSSYLVTYYQ